MAENTYAKKTNEKPKKAAAGKSIFQLMESSFGFSKLLSEGLPIKHFPKIAFVMTGLIIYIANTHYSDKVVRNSAKLNSEVEDLRADYTTLKADLMFKSKQSEVAKRVEHLGLEESLVPPSKLEVDRE